MSSDHERRAREAVDNIERILQQAGTDAARRGYEHQKFGVSEDDLQALGEHEVRKRLRAGRFGHPNTPPHDFVKRWLNDAEDARLTRQTWYAGPTGALLLAIIGGLAVAFIAWLAGWT